MDAGDFRTQCFRAIPHRPGPGIANSDGFSSSICEASQIVDCSTVLSVHAIGWLVSRSSRIGSTRPRALQTDKATLLEETLLNLILL